MSTPKEPVVTLSLSTRKHSPRQPKRPWGYNAPMSNLPYAVPACEVQRELRVANSRFIATLAPAASVAEAKAFIARIRQTFPDATHHVPAYIIGGGPQAIAHASDAGEPAGSAGRPMLAVLQGSGLGDVAVVVTRYFGGTKLGIGGLVRAYTQATQAVVAAVPRASKVLSHTVMLGLPYRWLTPARRLIAQHQGQILDETYAGEITLTFRLPTATYPAFADALRDLSAGQLEPLILETAFVRLPPPDLSPCQSA